MKRYKPLFPMQENVMTQSYVERLANLIINEVVQKSTLHYNEQIGKVLSNFNPDDTSSTEKEYMELRVKALGVYPLVPLVNLKEIALPSPLKTFVKSLGFDDLQIEFKSRMINDTRGTYYTQHRTNRSIAQIHVELTNDQIHDLEGNLVENYTNIVGLVNNVSHILRQTHTERILIHELQHYIDDQRSEGAYSTKGYDSSSKEYWIYPEEISARYTETIAQLNFNKDWKTLLFNFQSKILSWFDMDTKTQQRLIKRLKVEYDNYHKSKDEPLQDISKQVENLSKKYESDTTRFRLSYNKGSYIEIHGLKTKNIKQDEIILKEVIKLADIYRYTIMMYVEKDWVTSVKDSIQLLKKYNFFPNTGRKANYKYKTSKRNFIRYSKRK